MALPEILAKCLFIGLWGMGHSSFKRNQQDQAGRALRGMGATVT